MDLWTVGSTDNETEDVIAILRLALGVAAEAELAHPETISALRAWCNAEHKRLNPPYVPPSPEREILAGLQRSPWWRFWESLQAGQEVRWTGTRNATYFVVNPEPVTHVPDDGGRDGAARFNSRRLGAFIELRRHTGKTFWTHIAKVRPL